MVQHPGTQMLVTSAEDNEQENSPTPSDYQNYFASTYGIFVSEGIFRPERGNHDVQDAGHGQANAGYFDAVTHFDDIQINGHGHDYQRFYPINPAGQRDNVRGITTFITFIGCQDINSCPESLT
jgi:hypothetical protein